jgi:hypothetical protein
VADHSQRHHYRYRHHNRLHRDSTRKLPISNQTGVRSGVIVPLIPADAATAQTLTTATREQIKLLFVYLPPAKFRAGATQKHTTGQK